MCGVIVTAGLTQPFSHRYLESLRPRGPDDVGFWSNGSVHIGATRLAIIGLDRRSTGPLENDTHVLTYNGETYNFLELKRRLKEEGLDLPAANDAGVVLNAWSRWGEKALSYMHGFWAFAVYEKRTNKLVLVRDQLGIKPLYYAVTPEGICVASMIKTILEVLPNAKELDFEALSEYARYQFTFGNKTFMRQIRKVMPGEIVEIDLNTGAVSRRIYEDIFQVPSEGYVEGNAAWLEETRALLEECTNEATISDTAVTTFCSGGIDSSLITRLVRPELAYHCNFSDPDCNETFFAQQVIDGTPTRLFVVNAREEFDLVDRLANIVEDFDELTIGSVILPLDDVLEQVRRRFKVIMIGSGGDELFSGYVRYLLCMGQCNQDNYRGLFNKVRVLPQLAQRFELCHRKGDYDIYDFYDPRAEENFYTAFDGCHAAENELKAMLRFDCRYFLQGLLNIDDKMCGRHSIEGRPPFLHQKFVRHLQRISSPGLIDNGELKPLLRKIALHYLPDSVIHRKDKMGFTTPVGTFVNKSAHRIREQIENSRFRDFYRLKKVNFTAETKYSREVFGLLLLDLWLNRYA
jgi:asparagine synthase (glutamine-hydrolysing)